MSTPAPSSGGAAVWVAAGGRGGAPGGRGQGGVRSPACRAGVLPQAGLPGADRPGVPALLGEHLLGDGDLVGLAGLVGQALAAVVVPGGGVELQAAVVAVA